MSCTSLTYKNRDNLSETELKRLVGQLEKTRSDLESDLREMLRRLEKEGREFHHYDDFCRLYRAEILNLNRTLDALARNGILPASFMYGQLSQVYFRQTAGERDFFRNSKTDFTFSFSLDR